MRSRAVAALAVVVAVGTVAGGSIAGAQEEAGRPGVTDDTIRVGGVASVTNPLGGAYGDAFDGVKAYFEMINSQGGIYERDLELVAERDDQLANNQQEIQGLLSRDNVFAVLPVATPLFTGADLLVESGTPTFGWNINPEWGSENTPSPPNLFGDKGSYLCFTCAGPLVPWLAREVGVERIGVLAYGISDQSKDCAQGLQNSFEEYPTAEVVFVDTSLAFGVPDLSAQVSRMVDEDVDFVTTCMDNNGTLTLAREMRLQGLDAVQYLPNAYNHEFMEENAEFFEGSYVLTFFTPFEVRPKPRGLKQFERWMKRTDGDINENSMAGWLNADLFVAGLEAAGPEFTQQSVIDAVNAMTDYTARGLLAPVDWTVRHEVQAPCTVLSKVEDGEFDPQFGKKGKPFICFEPEPERLPRQPERV
jgi:ABC-type branched-subunit amino acid transport system substrate-binding protein